MPIDTELSIFAGQLLFKGNCGKKEMLRLATLTIIAFLLALPAHAQRQVSCLEKSQMHAFLKGEYGERPVVRGIESRNMIFELLINPTTKTWSVILTNPDNLACLVGHGSQIQFLKKDRCHPRSKEVKSNLGYNSASLDQTSYRHICAQGSSQIATARARSGEPPFPR